MNGSLRWKIVLTLLVVVFGVTYLLPSLPAVQNSSMARLLPDDKISLGLDLKGGIHLTLGVDMEKAMDNNLSRMGDDLRATAREEGIIVLKPKVLKGARVEAVLLKQDKKDELDSLVKENFKNLTIISTAVKPDGKVTYVFAPTPEYKKYLTKLTMDQAIKTIRNRIDQFGVAEPDIRKQEGNRIQVQLPGMQDPERAIKIIGKTAHLEFKLVDSTADLEKAKKGIVAPGREVTVIRHRLPDGSYIEKPIVLKKDAMLTGEYITDAQTRFDQFNQPYVTLNFNSRGSRIFERVTGENIKKQMAIVLDGKVYSAPTIQDKIAGGRASITGSYTTDEAHDLAIVLRAGSLPAPVKILEQRTVGPSLGQESIDKGIMAAIAGSIAVLIFMVVYYGFAGLIADTVLILNVTLILAALAVFGATLTLPGIAGIILTVGMAVDANVIIFERIREELRRGLTAKAAIVEGYSRATLTILDANITTVIAAVILYQFGTGPVRGFAVTLTLGILTSMFTAIFVTRIMFDLYTSKRDADAPLSI
ncbi:protein translocase subunit SecD [Maridesulfovibrio hydrothermalis]|uniref:Protein translocase subunit SecD n=1 Tax=Maridesulfovibrio hydrothermalis AM13 = DSM 14728 TaxID=1121451 RepID=L0RC11_9BACT|nr:protein translocase subunit SecD [Maridesulfovibrio hydrothermalis]CCO24318.1 Protein translocase subunit SecD [Maridesulfovibrio hydrothermalis AM13 = DSM 14728]